MATSTKQRLRFIDDTGTEQIIGEITGPGDEKGLSRGQLFHRTRQYDKVVVRGDVELKNNLPQDNTDHQDDPEVFFETYNPATDSWETRFRGFLINGGLIDRNNEVKALLYDFVKYHGGAEITIDKTGTTVTNIDIMDEAVSGLDVVIDHPTETEVQNNSDQDGFIRYDDYSMVKVARKRVIREQTKVTGWALKPTGETDGSGNWIWRYEPVGYGGTVDTLKDKSVAPSVSGSKAVIREWGFTRKEDIINKVELINTKNGGTVVGSYDASTESSPNSADRYGERYENFQIGFLDSTRADELAKKIVDRSKTAEEGGNLKASPRYEGNEANNSFEIRSDQKGIDGVFTCQEQINHYPERSTDFTFTFERQSESEAAAAENLRAERRKLFPSTGKNLSGQTGLTAPDVQGNTGDTSPDVDGDTGDTGPDVDGNTADTGPNVSGTSDAETSDNIDSDFFFDSSFSISDGWNQIGPLADITEAALVHEITIELSDLPDGSTYDFEIVVVREGSEVVFHDKVQNLNNSQVSDIVGVATDEHYQKTFRLRPGGWATQDPDTDSYELQLKTQAGANPTLTVSFETAALTHNHESGTYDADLHPHGDGTLGADLHPHDDGTLDADFHPHDDGTLDGEDHPHDQGTLEAETGEEDKTDRN